MVQQMRLLTWRLIVMLIGCQMGLLFLVSMTHLDINDYVIKEELVERGRHRRKYTLPLRNSSVEILPWSFRDWDHVIGSGTMYPVLYNRVGRCGSRAIYQLAKTLAKHANFRVHLVRAKPPSYKSLVSSNFTRVFSEYKKPLVYIRHMYFVSFEKENIWPVYINIVRDPVDRLVSRYFHEMEQGTYSIESYDKCIKSKASRCWGANLFTSQLRFFCGYDDICWSDPDAALQQAKVNIAKHYILVGTTERMRDFLSALEVLLPGYFAGVTSHYDKQESELHDQYRSKSRKDPSRETKELLKTQLKQEYEFYDFVKQRFAAQMRTLGMGT